MSHEELAYALYVHEYSSGRFHQARSVIKINWCKIYFINKTCYKHFFFISNTKIVDECYNIVSKNLGYINQVNIGVVLKIRNCLMNSSLAL